MHPGNEREKQDGRISHGICRSCLGDFMKGQGQALSEFLDSLGVPIIATDGNVRVLGANALAREAVSKECMEIAGRLVGEVFGCQHAEEAGGCGGTLHCLSCVLRSTVEVTSKTGNPSVQVPSCLDLDTVAGKRRVRFLVSTEKVDDSVLLRIDDAQPIDPSGNVCVTF
jgi:hypothetical protein